MSQKKNLPLVVLAILLAAASCIFHLKAAYSGTPLFRGQHLGTALEYAKSGINLLKPVIVGFNATGTPTPQELPVWQALVGLAFKIMGPWFGWANVVSLLCFFMCVFPLFWLAKEFAGERCAWWTLVFFLSQPLIFIYAGEAGTDGFSIMTAIWFLYFGVKLVLQPSAGWWVACALTGTLAIVSKLPFFMAAGLTCFFLLLAKQRRSIRVWLLLGSAGAVAGVLFLWWTKYTNACIAQAEFPFVDLRLSNNDSALWYFGSLQYRLVPANWIKGGWRILNTCFGSFALAGLFLYAFFFIKETLFPKLMLLSCAITTLVFTHLVLHHSHYYLMFAPAFAIFCAQTAVQWEEKLPAALGGAKQRCLLFFILAVVLGLSLVQGVIGMKIVFHFDRYPWDIAAIIQKYCAPDDKLLIEGGGWGGEELFLSDRRGLSIWTTELLEHPENYKRLKELGFNKLVMISDPPLLTALQQINPGQSKLQRTVYRSFETPIIKDWPTLIQTDDIMIKKIP